MRGNVIGLIAGVLIVFGAGFFLIDTGLRVDELGTSPTVAEQLIGWGGLLVGTVVAVTFFARLLMPRNDAQEISRSPSLGEPRPGNG